MKRIITLGVLALVLAVLFIGFVVLRNRPPEAKDELEKAVVPIISLDRQSIVEMIVQTPDRSLRLYKEGESWKADAEQPVELDETAVQDLEYSFSTLYAEEVVEGKPTDLRQYGLDPPQAVAAARLSDGSQRILQLGSQTTNPGMYYLKAEGDPAVYAVRVNHANHFRYELSDVRTRALPLVNLEEMSYLMISREGKVIMEVVTRDSLSEQPIEYPLGNLFMTSPYSTPRPIAADAWNDEFVTKFPALKIEKFVDDRPHSLAPYGLDNQKWEILIRDPECVLHLYIGDRVDDLVYFKLAGRPAVHMIKDDILDVLTVNPFAIMDKFAFIVNIDYVDRLWIRGPGLDHTLSIEREMLEKEPRDSGRQGISRGVDVGPGESTDRETTVRETFFLDGKQVPEDRFKRMYQRAIGLQVDAPYAPPVSGKAEVSLLYTMNEGGVDRFLIEFVPYNANFFALNKNGVSEFLTGRSQVENMLSDLDDLAEGKVE